MSVILGTTRPIATIENPSSTLTAILRLEKFSESIKVEDVPYVLSHLENPIEQRVIRQAWMAAKQDHSGAIYHTIQ